MTISFKLKKIEDLDAREQALWISAAYSSLVLCSIEVCSFHI